MSSLFVDLAALLRQEIEGYRRLLVLVRRERRNISRGELTGLTETVRKKEAIARELASLAASRASLLDRLAAEMGREPSGLTLAEVARLAPEGSGEMLQGLLIEFRGLVGSLVAASEVNRTLLDRSLEFVQRSLALFRVAASANPTYGKGGTLGESGSALTAFNQIA